jgi:predicted acylesterase/phospholipase RssA
VSGTIAHVYYGLALSGGGFRASFFHIGVLARLADLDLLRPIEAISTVSGGSIVGALYYLKLKARFESGQVSRKDYIEIVQEICEEFLEGVQQDPRCRTFGHFRSNLKGASSDRVGKIYEDYFYFRFKKDSERLKMRDLWVPPKDDGSLAKMPELYLNATVLDTGQRWVFTPRYMGVLEDAAKKPGLMQSLPREFVYDDATDPELRYLPLGVAVAASACVPMVFPPVSLPLAPFLSNQDLNALIPYVARRRQIKDEAARDYLKRESRFALVDGGVADNLGLGPMENRKSVIVSNASAPSGLGLAQGSAQFFGTVLRSYRVLMDRAQQAADLQALNRLGDGMAEISLQPHGEAEGPNSNGIDRDVIALLSQTRTDLDTFTDWEAHSLMQAGYSAAKRQLLPQAEFEHAKWPFEWVAAKLSTDQARKHLSSSDSRLKCIRLLPPGVLKHRVALMLLGAILGLWLVVHAADPARGMFETIPNILVAVTGYVVIALAMWSIWLRLFASLGLAIVSWGSLALRPLLLWLGRRLDDKGSQLVKTARTT